MPVYKRFTIPKKMDPILGIPVTTKYKYLGTWLYNNLDPRRHFSEINTSICFVSAKLTAVRMKGDLKTNINLFKVLILPKIRMVSGFFDLISKKQR